MVQVNMFEAKSDLSKLVKMLETREEDVIYIARNGVKIAQLTLIQTPDVSKRIGIAEGKMILPDDFDRTFDNLDREITDMFEKDSNL